MPRQRLEPCAMGRWFLFLTLLLTAPGLWAGGGWPAEDPGPGIHVGGCAVENAGFYRGNDVLSPGLHWGCNPVGHELAPGNKEDGLLFARARYFSPTLGRWISRDPAGYVDGYSLYNGYFVPNAMDPEGKMFFLLGFMIPLILEEIPNAFWTGLKSSPQDLAYGLARVGTGIAYSVGSLFDPEMRAQAINRGKVDREIWEMAEWAAEDPKGLAKIATIVVEHELGILWEKIPLAQRDRYVRTVLDKVGEYGVGRILGNITINLLTQKTANYVAGNIATGMTASGIGTWRKIGGSFAMGATIMAYQLYGAAHKMELASNHLHAELPTLWYKLDNLHHAHYLYGFIEPVIGPVKGKTVEFLKDLALGQCNE